jgi:hypothetical protein
MDTSLFTALTVNLPEGRIQVPATFDSATTTLTLDVIFTPASGFAGVLSFPTHHVTLDIPFEILQDRTFKCPAGTVFNHFQTTGPTKGSPVCKPIPPTVCPTGQYVSRIDPLTLDVTCTPAGSTIGCASNGEFINHFQWDGQSAASFTCRTRLDPFTEMSFAPTVVLDLIFFAQDPDTPDPTSSLPTPGFVVQATWNEPSPAPACF